jgi:hypothetical protein
MDTSPEMIPPSLFSISFHVRFFPALLWRIVHRKEKEGRSPFENHVPLEFTVLTVLSAASALWGLPVALSSGSIPGWIFGGAGLAAFILLFVNSIASAYGRPLSYECFSVKVFLFFVFFGLTAGSMIGRISFSTSGLELLLYGVGGLLPGYFAGILAGYWVQKLGWMAGLFELAAILAIPGMIVLGIVLMQL